MFLSSWIHFHWGMRVEKYFHLRKLTLHFRMQPTMPVFLSPRMTYPYPWKTLPSTQKKKKMQIITLALFGKLEENNIVIEGSHPHQSATLKCITMRHQLGSPVLHPFYHFYHCCHQQQPKRTHPKKENTIVTENPFFFVNRGVIMEMTLNM